MASRKGQKAAARERLRQEQDRRRQRNKRTRLVAIVAGVVVLVVAVVGGGIGVQQYRAHKQSVGKGPSGTVANGLGIPEGKATAPVTLTVYEDFRCPACKQFEDGYNKVIAKEVDAGKLRVQYHIATIIDSHGGQGSHVAGNAAACAQNVGKFRQFHDILYANQPDESADDFTAARVLDLSKQVDGLYENGDFRGCVQDQTYVPWLKKVQAQFDTVDKGGVSTPTLLLDGKVMFSASKTQIDPSMKTPAAFEKTVNKLAADKNGTG